MLSRLRRTKSKKDSSEQPSVKNYPKHTQELVSTCQSHEERQIVSPGLSSASPIVGNSYTDVHQPGKVIIENKGHTAMIKHHDKLVTAISTDTLNVAGILLSKEFISEEVEQKARLPLLTSTERATLLVTALRNKIKVAPERFQELLEIFTKLASTTEIVKMLQLFEQGNFCCD